MGIIDAFLGVIRRSPYWPVITHPQLKRLLPGIGISAIGGAMSSVVVSWLAIDLAPESHRPLWVGAAITANTLPGAIGALTLGRWLGRRRGPQLAGWDALLRFLILLAVPALHLTGFLGIEVFVALLALSSVMAAWGKAGRYTMLSEMLDKQHRLAGNAVVNLMLESSTVVGPLLAALLIERVSAAMAIGVVALTWGVLALTYKFAVPADACAAPQASASRASGLRVIVNEPKLLGLIALSFGFFFCFGPASVAIPLHVVDDLDGSAAVLAGFYTAFGIGAIAGTLVTGYLKKLPMMAATIVTVLGFGIFLGIVGSNVPVMIAWIAFGLCGLFWGPFPSTTTVLFQNLSPADDLSQVLAARGAALSIATPLGTMLGAPLALALGASRTLWLSAAGLLILGITATVFGLTMYRWSRTHRQ